jgi:glycosyltransferase involved in cell wall biosynthesis
LTGLPIIGTPHGLIHLKSGFKLFENMIKYVEKNIYPKIDRIIFLNESEQDSYYQIYHKYLSNATIIYSGVESYKRSIQKCNRYFNVLFVGRLVEPKGIYNLINSYELLPFGIRPNIKYHIVGDGYERNNIIKLVKNRNLQKTIILEGFQRNINRFYQRADIFVLPSNSEGFPLALLEAMSFGLPCIITDLNLPISKNSVKILKDNNPETIAKSISELYDSKVLRERLAKSAISEINSKFNFSTVGKEHIQLYRGLAK